MVGQGAHARRRPALHLHRAVDPLHRGRHRPVDEVTAAPVHQRAISDCLPPTKMGREEIHSAQVLVAAIGMDMHVYTSVYISRNEVEHRLGNVRISTDNQYYIDVFPK